MKRTPLEILRPARDFLERLARGHLRTCLAFGALACASALPATPSGPYVLLDMDTDNELDDLFAITYALAHHGRGMEVVGVVSSRYKHGSSPADSAYRGHQLNLRLLAYFGLMEEIPAACGQNEDLPNAYTYVNSDAADLMIEKAHEVYDTTGQKLIICFGGGVPNFASAMLKDPTIIPKVELWVNNAFRYRDGYIQCGPGFNHNNSPIGAEIVLTEFLRQGGDLLASDIFHSDERILTKAETDSYMKGKGGVWDYLIDRWEVMAPTWGKELEWPIGDRHLYQMIVTPSVATIKQDPVYPPPGYPHVPVRLNDDLTSDLNPDFWRMVNEQQAREQNDFCAEAKAAFTYIEDRNGYVTNKKLVNELMTELKATSHGNLFTQLDGLWMAQGVVTWTSWPTVGGVYDLTSNGRTAVQTSGGKRTTWKKSAIGGHAALEWESWKGDYSVGAGYQAASDAVGYVVTGSGVTEVTAANPSAWFKFTGGQLRLGGDGLTGEGSAWLLFKHDPGSQARAYVKQLLEHIYFGADHPGGGSSGPSIFSIDLTQPQSSATGTPGVAIELAASVTGNLSELAEVRFYIDGSLIATDASSPFTASWTPAQVGTYTVTAKAIAADGGVFASSPSAVSVFDASSGPIYRQSTSGLLVVEAENHTAKTNKGIHQWVTIPGVSGNGTQDVHSEPDQNVRYDDNYTGYAPRLDYDVFFEKTGTHYLWVRGRMPPAGGTSSDSIHGGLDGTAPATAKALTLSSTSYGWTNDLMSGGRAKLEVASAGPHTVNLWMREDGFIIDRILLTNDPNYTPSGNGPAESTREGGGGEVTQPQAAAPTISPNGGVFLGTQEVALASTTSGADIRYTTNGSTPTETSALYTGPFTLSGSATVKARAFANGYEASNVTSASFTQEVATVATPSITPPGGSYWDRATVSVSCATASAVIRYTVDGSAPTESSPIYSGPLVLTHDTTLKAKAFASGHTASAVATEVYRILTDTTPPSISKVTAEGTPTRLTVEFSETVDPVSAQDPSRYLLSPALAVTAAVLHTDGRTVDLTVASMTDGQLYTVTATGVKDRAPTPNASTTQKSFTFSARQLLAQWLFNENGGSIAASTDGLVVGEVHGATWTSGVENSALAFDGQNDRVEVRDFSVGGDSLTISAWIKADSFSVKDARIISQATGTDEQEHHFMLSTIESGGKIRLRVRLKVGGTTHTLIASSGNLSTNVWTHVAATFNGGKLCLFKNGLCVGEKPVSGTITSSASVPTWIGGNPDGASSRPFDGAIDDLRLYREALSDQELRDLLDNSGNSHPAPTVAEPLITPDGGEHTDAVTVSLTCPTDGAEIRYTTDGSIPNVLSPLYSSSIQLSASATVRAIAYKSAFIPSNVATASFTIAPSDSGGEAPGHVFQAGQDGLIVIEAENSLEEIDRDGHAWVKSDESAATVMQAYPDNGTRWIHAYAGASPELRYEADFPKAGTYYIWVRGRMPHGNAWASDSLHLGLDGQEEALAAAVTGFRDQHTWVNKTMRGHPVRLEVPSEGVHVINVWMREDGFILDRLLLTQSASYSPSGIGPEESAQGGSQSTPTPPADPHNLTATVTSATAIALSWEDAASNELAYEVERRGPSGTYQIVAADLPPGTESFSDILVSDGTTYTYRVRARNDVGFSAYSAEVSATTPQLDLGPAPTQPVFLQNAQGLVVIEAENYHERIDRGMHTWSLRAASDASGSALQATPDNGVIFPSDYDTQSPELRYQVKFVKSGRHIVWIRGRIPSHDGWASDSLHVGLNGQPDPNADKLSDFRFDYGWSRQTMDGAEAFVTVDYAGVHTLNLWMREDGMIVDKIIVTNDRYYIPSGDGPSESAQVADVAVAHQTSLSRTGNFISVAETSGELDQPAPSLPVLSAGSNASADGPLLASVENDNFVFEGQHVEGDFQAVLRVEELLGSAEAQAGLLVAIGDPRAEGRYAGLATRTDGSLWFTQAPAGTATALEVMVPSPDCWLLIERTGATLTLAASRDDAEYHELTRVEFSDEAVKVGLFIDGGPNGQQASATVSDEEITLSE